MRRIALSALATISSASSLAADLASLKEAPPILAPPLVYDWTGFYVGAQIGGEFGSANYFAPEDGFSRNVRDTGVFGGGFAGYNYQISSFVLGLQGEFNGSAARGSNLDETSGETIKAQQPWLGSIDGRIGYAFNRFLVYAIGGVAFSNVEHDLVNSRDVEFAFSDSRTGYDIGAGFEYAITRNWTARLEYRYYDFGGKSYASERGPFGGTLYAHNFKQSDNSVRVGVSYKFGAP